MEIIITSILTFISTNIDDIFLLMLFYSNKNYREKEIMLGQYAGITALIAISLVVSLSGLFIDNAYIGLLGLVPVWLGIKGLLRLRKPIQQGKIIAVDMKTGAHQNAITVAGVTFANGGDNIGIYVPLFASMTWPNKLTMVSVFLVLTFLWCLTAKFLTRHPYVAKAIDKYGHIATPFVLIALGLFIMYENGSHLLLVK